MKIPGTKRTNMCVTNISDFHSDLNCLAYVLPRNAMVLLHQRRIEATNIKLNPIDLFTGVKPDS